MSTILFAEHSLSWGRPLRVAARRRGLRVWLARSPAETLRLVERLQPDLLVFDGDFQIEGTSLVARVRELSPRTSLILLFSQYPPGLEEMCAGEGVVHCGLKPLSPLALLDTIASALPDGLAPAAPAHDPALILCVDDDPRCLRSLGRLLRWRGYRVATFEDGESALRALPVVRPDLAVLDVRMPGLDGLALARLIRERSGGRVPVVMLSAVPPEGGCPAPADWYLTKPCASQTLVDVVDWFAGDLDGTERELLRRDLKTA